MNLFEAFVFDVSERIGLVPTIWKDIERYLAADGKRQTIVCKFLLQDLDKGCSHTMDLNGLQIDESIERRIK